MKRIHLIIALLFACIILNAQNRFISIKGTHTNAVTKTLDEAIKTAQNGDTIYLPGGIFSIRDTVNKSVHLVGTGYNDRIPRTLYTTSLVGNLILGKKAKGTVVEGIKISEDGVLNIFADEVILKRCLIQKRLNFISSKKSQIINCIAGTVIGSDLQIYNSLMNQCEANGSVIENSIITVFINANNTDVFNTVFRNSYNSHIDLIKSYAYSDYKKEELRKTFKTAKSNYYYDLNNNYRLQEDIALRFPNLGIYKGRYSWTDGGHPTNLYIEKNNSSLDISKQLFRIRVKLKRETDKHTESKYRLEYWFDDNFAQRRTIVTRQILFENNKGETELTDGDDIAIPNSAKTISYQFQDSNNVWSAVITSPLSVSTKHIDGNKVRYWSDEDFSRRKTIILREITEF